MAKKELVPPFVPHLVSSADVSNFDGKHTQDTRDTGVIIDAYIGECKQTTMPNAAEVLLPHIDDFDYTAPALK